MNCSIAFFMSRKTLASEVCTWEALIDTAQLSSCDIAGTEQIRISRAATLFTNLVDDGRDDILCNFVLALEFKCIRFLAVHDRHLVGVVTKAGSLIVE